MMAPALAAKPRRRIQGAAFKEAGARLLNLAMVLAAIALLWAVAIWWFDIPAYLLPAPSAMGTALYAKAAAIAAAAGFTIFCTVAGMAISVLLALVLAVLFLVSPMMSRAMLPLIILVRTVPVIAIAPLVVMIFGRGAWNSIGIVALLTFFQIMLATRQGLVAPTRNTLELMHTYGASFLQTLVKVRIPFAIPFIFTGLRIAAGSAILCAMFAEWLSGAPGLGRLILDAYSTQDFALMWASILTGTVTAYLFFTLTIAAERLVQDWIR
jgi:ABC-type nitrate/sulfonate/bicarbonate transport system permease component